MEIEQSKWCPTQEWVKLYSSKNGHRSQLVYVFGNQDILQTKGRLEEIQEMYPSADIVVCSTSNEIYNGQVFNGSIVLSAIYFEYTKIQAVTINLRDVKDSFDMGTHISAMIEKDDLRHLMIFTDGNQIDPAHLLTGLHFNISSSIPITGGLAGNNTNTTITGLNDVGEEGNIVGVAFYGEKINIGHACHGGWTPFGPERFITKSEDNILYELDHIPIYDFYSKYLEGIVEDMKEAAKIYPFGLATASGEDRLIRAFLRFDENKNAVFAGDMPEGSKVRLLRTNINHLLDSAAIAAENSWKPFNMQDPEFALIVNCNARKLVLQDWLDEEIVAVKNHLGKRTKSIGFYSSGEFSPQYQDTKTELHNHTMTITTFSEDR